MSATGFNTTTELTGFWSYRDQPDNRPFKSCVVFDGGASVRSAKRLLKRVAPNGIVETTLLRLEEDLAPANGHNSATAAADSDLLVVALAPNVELPGFARAWFDQWIGLCDESHECALVALLTEEIRSGILDSDWAGSLERFAADRNLAFFCSRPHCSAEPERVCATVPEQSPPTKRSIALDWAPSVTLRWGINE